MAKLSERERDELARLVATSIDTMGPTEVARVTGLSVTSLRQYAKQGIPPGVRAPTVVSLRKLVGAGARPRAGGEDRTSPQSLVNQILCIAEELAAQMQASEATRSSPEPQRPRGARGGTGGTGTQGRKRRA